MHKIGIKILIDFSLEIREKISNRLLEEHYDWESSSEKYLYMLLLQILPQQTKEHGFSIDNYFNLNYIFNTLEQNIFSKNDELTKNIQMIIPFFHKSFEYKKVIGFNDAILNINQEKIYKNDLNETDTIESMFGCSSKPKRKKNKFYK